MRISVLYFYDERQLELANSLCQIDYLKNLFIKEVEDYETLDGCDRNGEDLMKPFDLKEVQNAFKNCKSKAKPVSGLSPWDL